MKGLQLWYLLELPQCDRLVWKCPMQEKVGVWTTLSSRDASESMAAKAPETRLCTVSWSWSALDFPPSGRCDKPHRWVMSSLFSPDNLHRSNRFIHVNLPHEIKISCSKSSDWAASDLYFMVWRTFIGDVIGFMSWCEATIDLTGWSSPLLSYKRSKWDQV